MNSYLDPQYAKELKGMEKLTEEQTLELVALIKQGNKAARDRLVTANLRLICYIAAGEWRLKCQNMEPDLFMDLVQAGNLALLSAADKYEPDKGARFSTYAAACAVYEIRREIKKLRDYIPSAGKNGGILAKLPLDMVLIAEEGITLEDMLRADTPDPSETLRARAEIDELTDNMAQLDENELTVLKYLYGIDCEQITSYRAIGKKMGLTEYTVKAFAEIAMRKIKNIYGV